VSHKKPVTLDGVTYESLAAAAEALGISTQAVWNRVNPENVRAAVRRHRQHKSERTNGAKLDKAIRAMERLARAELGKAIRALGQSLALCRERGIGTHQERQEVFQAIDALQEQAEIYLCEAPDYPGEQE
jgi:hypothetical protein